MARAERNVPFLCAEHTEHAREHAVCYLYVALLVSNGVKTIHVRWWLFMAAQIWRVCCATHSRGGTLKIRDANGIQFDQPILSIKCSQIIPLEYYENIRRMFCSPTFRVAPYLCLNKLSDLRFGRIVCRLEIRSAVDGNKSRTNLSTYPVFLAVVCVCLTPLHRHLLTKSSTYYTLGMRLWLLYACRFGAFHLLTTAINVKWTLFPYDCVVGFGGCLRSSSLAYACI